VEENGNREIKFEEKLLIVPESGPAARGGR